MLLNTNNTKPKGTKTMYAQLMHLRQPERYLLIIQESRVNIELITTVSQNKPSKCSNGI